VMMMLVDECYGMMTVSATHSELVAHVQNR
jgi:hypothetical protein